MLAPRYGNSLERLVAAHQDGCTDKMVASALDMAEEEVQPRLDEIVTKLRATLKVI